MEARELPVTSPYGEWLEREGLPVLDGFFIEDVSAIELAPWKRKGALGAYVRLEGTDDWTGAYVCEIPPRGATHPQRYVFEEMIFIVKGMGATTVWQEGQPSQTFEWHPGSLFAIPLNAWHRHFNSQGGEPARYLAVTNLPLFMNLLREPDFIFSNPFVFRGRFDGEQGYFKDQGQLYRHDRTHYWETNFIADIYQFALQPAARRGAGGSHIEIMLAQNSMGAHISEFPSGRYKKAHRHGPGAHVVILTGQGYSLLWEAGKEKIRVDWKPGSVVVPPNQWFHQHFNTSTTPARYLALRFSGDRYQVTHIDDGASTNLKEGGNQIEYEDEDMEIHRMFHEALAPSGQRCDMEH